MTKSTSICLTLVMAFFLLSLAIERPEYISDHNLFLKDFIGANLLNVLGVILAITLASSAQLHLEFNKAEERHGKRGFRKSRDAIRGANMALIVLFVVAVVVLVAKSIEQRSDNAQAAFNAIELFVLFLNVLFLAELAQAAFSIRANIVEPKDPQA